MLGSPIGRHKIGPKMISCVIEFHKWNIIPMAIEIGTGYLLMENRTYVKGYEYKVF